MSSFSDDFIEQAAGDVEDVANSNICNGYEQRQLLAAAALLRKVHYREKNDLPVPPPGESA